MRHSLGIVTSVVVALIATSAGAFAEKKKVVFLADGGKNSKTHAHVSGNALLGKALEESGLGFETVQIKGWPQDPKAFDGADCVVIFCNGGGGHLVMKDLDRFEKLIDEGVGLVCLHYGVEVPKGRAGELMLKGMGGYFETHWSVNPHWQAVIEKLPKHPITRGCKPFVQNDEWYFHMRFQQGMKGVTPILSAHPPEETMKRGDGPHSNNPHVRKAMAAGEIQHIGWAYERPDGMGRGFGTTGAHYHDTWDDDNWRTLILNAITWTSGVEVPEKGVPSKPNPVKGGAKAK
ncbi:MAG: ThuA domain-containing protein [Roseibacillus sp.]|jgi:type 1 glutamine amidotransferase